VLCCAGTAKDTINRRHRQIIGYVFINKVIVIAMT